jgi:membrane-bound ClpP family serine protease
MNTEKSSRLLVQKMLASILLVLAILLLAFTIYTESEPGALPLLLLLIGSSWYLITRYRLHRLKKTAH